MKGHLALYAIALSVLVVGLAVAGVPGQTMFFALLALACPLMMVVMAGGGHGDPGEHPDDHHRGSPPGRR